ncbi:MAG TPA: hypothetical protein VG077_15170 [Verrucomicrobiae bacterium]|nr:hypothetical protein [Verrucomicrobiae bacterium]
MKKLLASAFLIPLVFAGGCGKSQPTTAGNDSDGRSQDSLIAGIDKHGDEIMASATKAEARQWMQQPGHVFFKADPKEVAQFVEDFYQAGAVQVFIADIEAEGGNQYGESLLVVLPKDPTARARLFEVEARADTAFQDDSVSDQGQKYLYNGLD